jgi:hypothetical protein
MKKPRIPKKIREELKHFEETGIPRCMSCHKDFIKVKEQSGKDHSTWKSNCDCKGSKHLGICIG